MDVDVVVGVYMRSVGSRTPPTNFFQVVGESFQILEDRNQSSWRSHCDLVIEPKVQDARWDEFERADDLIAAGEAAARAALPALRRLLQERQPRTTVPSRTVRRPSTAILQPDVTA